MALLQQLGYLLLLGSLAVASVIPATPRHLEDDDTPLPLIIWHGSSSSPDSASNYYFQGRQLTRSFPIGLGDNYAAEGLQQVGALAEEANRGTYVYFVRTADDASQDRTNTFFGNVTEQLSQVCADIAADPILSTAPAVDALGFSQGGVFLRGYVERCSAPPIRSLVTFGAPHNGITAFRDCDSGDWLCRGAMALLSGNTWSAFVQRRLVPAQYFRDPQDYDNYLENSNFLADVNNEREAKTKSYGENISNLENLVMYMFDEDNVLIPKESAWFEEVNGTESLPLRARDLYRDDWLGLRQLDRKGGLHFRTAPGDHMTLSEELLNAAFKEFYGPLKKSADTAEPDEL